MSKIRPQKHSFGGRLHASLLPWPTAIMRDRCNILNRTDDDSRRLQTRNRALATRSRPFDLDFHFLHTEFRSPFRTGLGRTLSSKRGALSASLKSDSACRCPAQNVSVHVRDRHDRVVERRLNVGDAPGNISANFTLFNFCHDETCCHKRSKRRRVVGFLPHAFLLRPTESTTPCGVGNFLRILVSRFTLMQLIGSSFRA